MRYTNPRLLYYFTSDFKKQTSAILEFYFQSQFRPHHQSRHVILHQSAKFHPNRTAHGRKMTSCRFSRWRISIWDFRGPVMVSLKSPCRTFCWSSVDTIALNCLVLEIILVHAFWWQTDRWTDKQMDSPNALSRLRYHEQRLNNTLKWVICWWQLSVLSSTWLYIYAGVCNSYQRYKICV